MLEEIGAITRHARHFIAKIDVGRFFEEFDFPFRRDFIDHRFEFIIPQRWEIDADQFAIDAEHRRVVGREMKIGSLLLSHQLEK